MRLTKRQRLTKVQFKYTPEHIRIGSVIKPRFASDDIKLNHLGAVLSDPTEDLVQVAWYEHDLVKNVSSIPRAKVESMFDNAANDYDLYQVRPDIVEQASHKEVV